MPPPPASWQYLFASWHQFRHVSYLRHQQQVDHWPFDLESGVRVKCDVGYLCANFSLPRPLCSRARPDVRVRRQTERRQTSGQTDVGQKHRLMPPPCAGGGIIMARYDAGNLWCNLWNTSYVRGDNASGPYTVRVFDGLCVQGNSESYDQLWMKFAACMAVAEGRYRVLFFDAV